MKRIISFLLALVLVIPMIPNAFAQSDKPVIDFDELRPQDFTFEIADGEVIITGYTGVSANVYISDTLDDCPVVKIQQGAFAQNATIKAVMLPNSLKMIDEGAFAGCDGLTDVFYVGTQEQWDAITIETDNEPITEATLHFIKDKGSCGKNLIWILDEAGTLTISGRGEMDDFERYRVPWSEYDEQVKTIVLDPRITAIGNSAFYFLPYVSTVAIPEGVTRIGEYAFSSCYGLRSVNVPASVTEIGRHAFSDNLCLDGIWVDENNPVYSSDEKGVLFNKDKTVLIQAPGGLSYTYTVPATVTEIAAYAFEYSYVDAVVLPNGLKTIGRNAFNGCVGMTSVVLPDSVTEIGYKSFSNMECLSEVTISSGLTVIPEAAFYGNVCLTAVIIPEGVQTIGPAAFAGCGELKEVTIPVSVTKIEAYGFGSPNLTDVYYKGTQEQWNAIVMAENNDELLGASIHYAKHNHNHNKKVTAPTCTAKGYTTYTCDCGDTYRDNYTNALGHNYKSGKCTRCSHRPVGAKITVQPTNAVVKKGKTAQVTVKATGTGLKYTWYYAKKGSTKFTMTNVTSATYSVKMSNSVNGGKVYCVVTDSYGNAVTSKTVTLYKGTPAKITTQPKNITVANAKTGKLSIKASGSGLKYRWYVKYKGASAFTKVGKSSKTYSFKMEPKFSNAQVYCVVTDKYGIEVASSVVTIKMPAQPTITSQPDDVTQVKGKKASFSVKANGEGLKYQWYYAKKGSSKFKKVSGARKATYTVKASSSVNGRTYYCLVTDKYGQTVKSEAATLTMKTVAKITSQPKNVTVKSGKTAKFTVKAVGDGIEYVWFVGWPNSEWELLTWGTNTVRFKTTKEMNGLLFMCCVVDQYENVVMSKEVKLKVK